MKPDPPPPIIPPWEKDRRWCPQDLSFADTYWSDGKLEPLEFLELRHLFIRCKGCGFLFKKSQSIPHMEGWSRKMPRPEPLTAGDCLEVLDHEMVSTEYEEKYIRIRLWWALNDAYRDHRDQYQPSPVLQTNLERLLDILNDYDVAEGLHKADIYRQLGRFTEAAAQLAKVDTSWCDFYHRRASTIREAIEQHDCMVRLVVANPDAAGYRKNGYLDLFFLM